jgi:hypothetical protein
MKVTRTTRAIIALSALLILLLAGAASYWLVSESTEAQTRAARIVDEASTARQRRLRACRTLDIRSPTYRDCVEHALTSYTEEVNSGKDLVAQAQMALWAKWLLIATLVQVPLNVIGLIFLLRTIWQGQEALSHARRVSYQELRAYVFTGFPELSQEGDLVRIYVPIRNSGQTPALRVYTSFGVELTTRFQNYFQTSSDETSLLSLQ